MLKILLNNINLLCSFVLFLGKKNINHLFVNNKKARKETSSGEFLNLKQAVSSPFLSHFVRKD
jgi:hypothetical protein